MPSAFTGYSFHVSEAFLVFANEVLVCFIFPIDLRLHRIYHLLSTLIHQGMCSVSERRLSSGCEQVVMSVLK